MNAAATHLPERSWGGQAFEGLLYGNYFLGICAAAKALETVALLGLPGGQAWLLGFVFCGTVLFYTYPYVRRRLPVNDTLMTVVLPDRHGAGKEWRICPLCRESTKYMGKATLLQGFFPCNIERALRDQIKP